MSSDRSGGGRGSAPILPPPPASGADATYRHEHLTPEPDSLQPTVTVPPPPPIHTDPTLMDRVRNSLPPVPGFVRRSMIPIRNTLAPFAPYIRRTWEPIRATIAPWVPRWKPWSPQRVLAVTAAFAALMGLAVLVAPKQVRSFYNRVAAAVDPRKPEAAPAVTPGGEPKTRADLDLQRKGRAPVSGALFALPPSFASEDGA